MEEALKKALQWWNEEARFLTEWRGDETSGDEYNVFDEPGWVREARRLLSEDEDDKNDNPTSNPVLLSSAIATLFHTDAELLGKNPNAMVRQEPVDDIAVKDLYVIWEAL